MASTWACQRVTGGVKCGAVNPKRLHICPKCGKKRPPTKRAAHNKALGLPYKAFLIVNDGSPNCGICGRPPPEGGKHRRDHEHKGDGLPRGLLCWTCNLALRDFATVEWLRGAAAYLERAEQRRGMDLSKML